jgi:transposase-like protein
MTAAEREANRQQWRVKIEAWRGSGQRLSAWAREQGVSRDALEYWRRQFPAEALDSERPSGALTLIPVQPAMPVLSPSAIEILLETRPGLRLSLLPGFDVVSLTRVLDVLDARC